MEQNKIKTVTQIEHILLRPNMYIGSTEVFQKKILVFENQKLVQKK
jgi:DNA gyrase/topoisomerase IV subunit B